MFSSGWSGRSGLALAWVYLHRWGRNSSKYCHLSMTKTQFMRKWNVQKCVISTWLPWCPLQVMESKQEPMPTRKSHISTWCIRTWKALRLWLRASQALLCTTQALIPAIFYIIHPLNSTWPCDGYQVSMVTKNPSYPDIINVVLSLTLWFNAFASHSGLGSLYQIPGPNGGSLDENQFYFRNLFCHTFSFLIRIYWTELNWIN